MSPTPPNLRYDEAGGLYRSIDPWEQNVIMIGIVMRMGMVALIPRQIEAIGPPRQLWNEWNEVK
jgi:hypothetical protein